MPLLASCVKSRLKLIDLRAGNLYEKWLRNWVKYFGTFILTYNHLITGKSNWQNVAIYKFPKNFW